MIRIAIVEDEDIYVKELQEYLKRYEKEKGRAVAVTVFRDGDQIVHRYKPEFDIILMDIQMKFVDGMTAAEEIREMDAKVVIMFITNRTEYAIRGYEVGALDYILKPISYFAFSQKLDRAVARIPDKERHYLTISGSGGDLVRLDIADVCYVESSGHSLIFHTAGATYTASGTLKKLEEELAPLGFSRGNSCYLINLAHVSGVRDKCAVVGEEELRLSRPRQKDFMWELTRYWGEQN